MSALTTDERYLLDGLMKETLHGPVPLASTMKIAMALQRVATDLDAAERRIAELEEALDDALKYGNK